MRRMMLATAWATWLVIAWTGRGEAFPDATPAAAADLRIRSLDGIAPGTVIGSRAPRGWSRLVLYANPRIAAGDLEAVPRAALQYAGMFHLTILANVKPAPGGTEGGYSLDKVAIGSAVEIGGKKVIITSEQPMGADLGLIGRRVLQENEKILRNDVRQVARTRTMLVFDVRAFVLYNGKHAPLIIRHAVLCSPADGTVTTIAWLLGASRSGGYALAEGSLQWLPPDLQEDRQLHVDAGKFTLGVPSTDAFALIRIPQGSPVPLTRDLASAASTARFDAEAALRLEGELRRACDAAGLAGREAAPEQARR